MAENAKAAVRLQEQLAEGQVVISLDPSTVDGSAISDRLPVDVDPGFDQLVASIAENGQQVPILVRPHPEVDGRYQIAYGRRRLRAAQSLGQPVRAIVQALRDDELVIAQGRENLDRADLSFIERALFARRLDEAGFDRSTIVSALASDKADISRYISVARTIPESLAMKIGPAPKAGRARWVALAEGLNRSKAPEIVGATVTSEDFLKSGSDDRFSLVLKAVLPAPKASPKQVKTWISPSGKKAARVVREAGRLAVIFEEKQVPAFGAFVAARLDELYTEFLETAEGGGTTD
jgi:ParB family chromosome partitioning protein